MHEQNHLVINDKTSCKNVFELSLGKKTLAVLGYTTEVTFSMMMYVCKYKTILNKKGITYVSLY